MAIVCLVVVVVALGIGALISLKFWEVDSVDPPMGVELGPGLEASVGGATALGRGDRLAIAPAQPAPGIGSAFAARDLAAGEGEARPRLEVAPAAVVVGVSTPAPAKQPGSPASQAPSAQQPAPAPEAVPVAAPAPAAVPAPGSAQETPAVPGRPAPGGSAGGPIAAGGGSGVVSGPVAIADGDELAYGFSFLAEPTAYREPGSENAILRFAAPGAEPTFALQLWDDGEGGRGLWASGDAMGGERFLAPLEDGVWHQVAVAFRASGEDDGFYVLLLDGEPIDARAPAGLLDGDGDETLLEAALYRDGVPASDPADVLIGPARLGDSLESVLP